MVTSKSQAGVRVGVIVNVGVMVGVIVNVGVTVGVNVGVIVNVGVGVGVGITYKISLKQLSLYNITMVDPFGIDTPTPGLFVKSLYVIPVALSFVLTLVA